MTPLQPSRRPLTLPPLPPGQQVRISIDEIDLSEVDPARRFQVVATFETELSRLVRSGGLEGLEGGALVMGHAEDTRLDLAIDVSPQHNPVHLGLALARSVYGALL